MQINTEFDLGDLVKVKNNKSIPPDGRGLKLKVHAIYHNAKDTYYFLVDRDAPEEPERGLYAIASQITLDK